TELPPELRDTYEIYELPEGLGFAWLDEDLFLSLPRSARVELVGAQRRLGREQVPSVKAWGSFVGDRAREQADGHRFVWWPSLLRGLEERVLTDYVEHDRRPSRHEQVSERTWRASEHQVPGGRMLAAGFPGGSGPNCFATVMAAAGVTDAGSQWMQREPFENWLAESTCCGGSDARPGTVLVWRSHDAQVQHAAVTIGDGWALHKPSQGWFDPVKVLAVADIKRSARAVGQRLHRYTLNP
ncbi:MAG: hypothetical protein ACRDXB_21335, partial [Actinomycetes bacterium]